MACLGVGSMSQYKNADANKYIFINIWHRF